MSRIKLTDPKAATGIVGEIFGEIKKTFGMVPNLFRAYANNPDLAEIEKIKRLEFNDEREGAIVNFAFKAATDPHHVTDQDLQRLRDLAFSDKQILEALGVMEIFSAYNRFLDALDVPL